MKKTRLKTFSSSRPKSHSRSDTNGRLPRLFAGRYAFPPEFASTARSGVTRRFRFRLILDIRDIVIPCAFARFPPDIFCKTYVGMVTPCWKCPIAPSKPNIPTNRSADVRPWRPHSTYLRNKTVIENDYEFLEAGFATASTGSRTERAGEMVAMMSGNAEWMDRGNPGMV